MQKNFLPKKQVLALTIASLFVNGAVLAPACA